MRSYDDCLAYIEAYWDKMTCTLPEDREVHMALPNPYVAPTAADGLFAYDQFYWDSYFIILGLVSSGRTELAKGMIDNLVYLFNRFKIVPMRNRYFNLGISQPPFLTSMIAEVFKTTKNTTWLKGVADTAATELETYWKDDKHIAHRDLSRYCDHFIIHATSEFESGWDTTSRFQNECLDILPIDLNSCLYRYEMDLAQFYESLGDAEQSEKFIALAGARKKAVSELMYDPEKGFFFDYNYFRNSRNDFYSLAGFYPLWAKLASREEAEAARRALVVFEYDGGLANTGTDDLSDDTKQWDYPNGWPNQQWIVIQGLMNYGFKEDAQRIAKKWMDLNVRLFQDTGKMWEKYDVVSGTVGKSDRYPLQHGFGWTNAVFVRLYKDIIEKH